MTGAALKLFTVRDPRRRSHIRAEPLALDVVAIDGAQAIRLASDEFNLFDPEAIAWEPRGRINGVLVSDIIEARGRIGVVTVNGKSLESLEERLQATREDEWDDE